MCALSLRIVSVVIDLTYFIFILSVNCAPVEHAPTFEAQSPLNPALHVHRVDINRKRGKRNACPAPQESGQVQKRVLLFVSCVLWACSPLPKDTNVKVAVLAHIKTEREE